MKEENRQLWKEIRKPLLLILIGLMLLAFIGATSAVPNGGVAFWNLTKLTDEWDSKVLACTSDSGTCSGSTAYPTFGDGTTTGYNSSFLHNGGDYEQMAADDNDFDFGTGDFTISTWVRFTAVTGNSGAVISKGAFGTNNGFAIYQATTNLVAKTYGASSSDITESFTNLGIGAGKWVNLIYTREETGNGSNMTLWVNGTIKTTKTSIHRATQDLGNTCKLTVGAGDATPVSCAWTSAYQFEGDIDHLQFFNRALTPAEITTLFQTGTLPDSTTGNPFIIIKAYDAYDNTSIDNFTVNLNNGTSLSTTNGSVIFNNTIGNYSFNITNIFGDTGVYFNLTGIPNYTNVEAAANATTYTKLVYPFQSVINFTAYAKVSNASLTGVTFYVNGTSGTEFNLKAGANYQLIAQKATYYNETKLFNVSPLDIKTVNITGLYNARVLISPRDILNNNTISEANITISNSTYSFTTSASNVTNATFNLTTGKYLLEITATDRNSYAENITITSTGASTYYAYMYAYNSLWVYAYDALNASPISTFSVIVDNGTHSYTGNTSTGVAYINDILSGSWDVTVTADNYSAAFYTITVTDNSHQTLNAYLTTAADSIIFTFKDKNTNAVIEGVNAVQKSLVNGSLTTIASENSDIAGLVQFFYASGIEYTFVITKTGYTSRTFTIEPILSGYTVLLTPLITGNETVIIDDAYFTIDQKLFRNNATSYITVTFGSGAGTFEYYNVTIINDYNSTTVNGTNAAGETLNASVFLIGVGAGAYTKVIINYRTTLSTKDKTVVYMYAIDGFTPGLGSMEEIRDELETLGDLEKALIGTLIVAFIAGIFFLGGAAAGEGLLIGSLGALAGLVIAAYIGLFPWAVIYASGFVLFMVIASRVSGGTQ